MMEALVKAKKDGKTRFIGTSTHKNEPNVIRATVDAGIYDVVLTAQSVVLGRKEDIKKAIAYAASIQNPLYCQNCRSCISSCPKEVEIPSLMRAYMYAEGYGNLLHAAMTAEVLPEDKGLKTCAKCSTCSASCQYGIKIYDRLQSLFAQGLTRS